MPAAKIWNGSTWELLVGSGSGGAVALTHRTVTAATTAVAEEFISADATTAAFTVTLPTTPASGTRVGVKKIDTSTNIVTVVGAGGATIEGDANATLTSRYAGATFIYNGVNWLIHSPAFVGGNVPNPLTLTSSSTTSIPLTIRGAASQTGNLLEFYNNAGTPLAYVNANGSLIVSPTGTTDTNSLVISTASTNSRGLIVKGLASQTGNLAEFQNNLGTPLAFFNGAGRLSAPNLYVLEANPGGISAGTTLNQTHTFPAGSFATAPVAIAQGYGGGENAQDPFACDVRISAISSTQVTVRLRNTGSAIQSITYRVFAYGGL